MAASRVMCYILATSATAKQLLERVASWPDEDIAKLEEAAREIEAWRSGEYRVTEDELRAIDEAIAELENFSAGPAIRHGEVVARMERSDIRG